MNCRNRGASLLFAVAVLGVHFRDLSLEPGAWALMLAQLVVSLHVAFLCPRCARDPLAAVIQSMLLDKLCFGLRAAALGFPLWIACMLIICGCIKLTAFRAGKGRSAGAGRRAHSGWRFNPDTSLLVSALSMACLTACLLRLAGGAHSRTVV